MNEDTLLSDEEERNCHMTKSRIVCGEDGTDRETEKNRYQTVVSPTSDFPV